jgi:hypothetical protein
MGIFGLLLVDALRISSYHYYRMQDGTAYGVEVKLWCWE